MPLLYAVLLNAGKISEYPFSPETWRSSYTSCISGECRLDNTTHVCEKVSQQDNSSETVRACIMTDFELHLASIMSFVLHCSVSDEEAGSGGEVRRTLLW